MRRGTALPAVFGAVAAAHLAGLLAGAPAVVHATKPALMPLLAACVLARRGPRLLALALLFGCGGDTLLQIGGDTVFLLGMGSFAAGHVCYLVLFARHGAASGRGRTYGLAAGYAVVWAGVVALLWPGLEAGLRVPVAVYSLLLTAMAYGATRTRVPVAAGAALFLLSDTLIASGLADGWPRPPLPQFWIMLTYAGGQALLAAGLLRHIADAGGAGPRRPGPSASGEDANGRQSRTAARASTMP
ncbi:lysoplasmalogenase [Streptomyces sp. NPDC049577]|uniref:lysoplasmalogenase n=1 Tax=Streptomyces sp. NPDC049577 TaxID=3155153 RepID=UPI0034358F6B